LAIACGFGSAQPKQYFWSVSINIRLSSQLPFDGSPVGSSTPSVATPGFYTAGGSDSTTRTTTLPCNAGFFCQEGAEQKCGEQAFAEIALQLFAQVLLRSTVPAAAINLLVSIQLTLVSFFLPLLSCSFFDILLGIGSTDGVTNTDETECPAGFFCFGGVQNLCGSPDVSVLSRRFLASFVLPFFSQFYQAGRTETIWAPLFPGYLFIILDLTRDRWRSVNGTYGVDRLLTRASATEPVPHGPVEQLLLVANAAGG